MMYLRCMCLMLVLGLAHPVCAQDVSQGSGLVRVEDDTTLNLIAEISTIPGEPDSFVDRYQSGEPRVPLQQQPRPEQVAHELKIRFYKSEAVSEADQDAFVRVARGEPASVLTDPGSMRGEMYRYIFDALLRQKRLSYEDERWARSVHDLKIEHARAIQYEWFAYAHIQVRRLARDNQWRVQIDRVLYEPVMRGEWVSWDGWYDLRPVGKGKLDWWDYNQRIYSELVTNSGFSPETTLTRQIHGRIFEGDKYIDLWWPVAEFKEEAVFEKTRAKRTPPKQGASGWYERVESIEGYAMVEDPKAYTQWLAKHLQVQIDHSDRDAWIFERRKMMPDRFRFYLAPDKGDRNPDLRPFTFGGLISVVLEFAPGGRYEGPMPLKRVVPLHGEPAWWALRAERDKDGNRVFANGSGFVTLKKPERASIPTIALNDTLVGAYLEVRFGMEVLGDDGYRATADLEAERFLTETVRIPIDSYGLWQLAEAVKARGHSLDIGYKYLYEDGEIEAMMKKYNADGYSYRSHETRGSSRAETP